MTEMKTYSTERRKYERPAMRVYELQHRTMILAGSNPTTTAGAPTYNKFSETEEEW